MCVKEKNLSRAFQCTARRGDSFDGRGCSPQSCQLLPKTFPGHTGGLFLFSLLEKKHVGFVPLQHTQDFHFVSPTHKLVPCAFCCFIMPKVLLGSWGTYKILMCTPFGLCIPSPNRGRHVIFNSQLLDE